LFKNVSVTLHDEICSSRCTRLFRRRNAIQISGLAPDRQELPTTAKSRIEPQEQSAVAGSRFDHENPKAMAGSGFPLMLKAKEAMASRFMPL